MRTQGLWVQSLRLAFQQCTGGAMHPKRAHGAVGDIERGMLAFEPPIPSQLQVCLQHLVATDAEGGTHPHCQLLLAGSMRFAVVVRIESWICITWQVA